MDKNGLNIVDSAEPAHALAELTPLVVVKLSTLEIIPEPFPRRTTTVTVATIIDTDVSGVIDSISFVGGDFIVSSRCHVARFDGVLTLRC